MQMTNCARAGKLDAGFALGVVMTPSEFKAWFDGFTEAFTGCPTKAQWARVKERVAEIDGKPTTQTVYIDRYVRPSPYWQHLGYSTCVSNTVAGGASSVCGGASYSTSTPTFNSIQSMSDLGRADAKLLSQ
jgi:hypothetical protein